MVGDLKDRERHISVGRYLKDAVYAANDGIITTFAVVAATVGGSLPAVTVLIIGFANVIADGFSMATGNYLGTKSERELYAKEEALERREVAEIPERERQEIRDILALRGYQGKDLDDMVRLISSNEKFWIDFMMAEELQFSKPRDESPLKNSLVTFVSFVVAGCIPLLPYVAIGRQASFSFAVVFASSALFLVGALRSYFSQRSWFGSGIEMLVVGGFAAAVAYGIGFVVRSFV